MEVRVAPGVLAYSPQRTPPRCRARQVRGREPRALACAPPSNRCETALIRDGMFLHRLLATSAAARRVGAGERLRRRAVIRRAGGLEGISAYREGSRSRRVGDSRASFSHAWRRTALRGGVPAGVLENPRAQLLDPPRALVPRPRPSLALPRDPVRAVEFHALCTAWIPAPHRER